MKEVSLSEKDKLALSFKEATHFNVIGRALEDKNTSDIGYVEAFVTIK
jgi:hypothetical protein